MTRSKQMPKIMGVLNVTPDSFSDGGKYNTLDTALYRVDNYVASGVDSVDVGGESTRPNASPVTIDAELDRVIPVIEAISHRFDIPISIDTRKTAVMQAAITAGATIINDVCALQDEGALDVAARSDVTVCLMHMQGTPQTMQQAPHYDDCVQEVIRFLQARVIACVKAGIQKERIVLDPGFGFGKTLSHNRALLHHLRDIVAMGFPVLVGVSRKSMIRQLIGTEVVDCIDQIQVYGSIAAALFAAQQGAHMIRTHDVAETKAALTVWCQLETNGSHE